MSSTSEAFQRLTSQLRDEKPAFILAELNDLLTGASSAELELLSSPSIDDP
jgi:hypothetical protein